MKKIRIIFTTFCAIILTIASYSEGAKAKITLIPKKTIVQAGKTKKFVVRKTGRISKNVKWYVKVDESSIGNGDGSTTSFTLENQNIQENSELISVGGMEKTKDTDYTIDYVLGIINFIVPPDNGIEITASYYAENGGENVGTIDSATGIYTAPAKDFLTSNPMDIEIKAVSVNKPKISGKAVVTVFSYPSIISLSISPKTSIVGINETLDLTLNMVKRGKKNLSVKWFVKIKGGDFIEGGNSNIGTIVGTGLTKGTYKAPTKILAKPVIIKVVSALNENIFSTAKVTVVETDQLIGNGIGPSFYFGSIGIGQVITIPIQRTFTISTKSGNAVPWQVVSYPQWLKVTPVSGTTPDQVVIEITDTGRLNIGLNQGNIIFQSTKSGVNPLTINVSVTATPQF